MLYCIVLSRSHLTWEKQVCLQGGLNLFSVVKVVTIDFFRMFQSHANAYDYANFTYFHRTYYQIVFSTYIDIIVVNLFSFVLSIRSTSAQTTVVLFTSHPEYGSLRILTYTLATFPFSRFHLFLELTFS